MHYYFSLKNTARSQSRTGNEGVTQLDGQGDSSDDHVEEEDDHDDEEIDADNEENADEEPLNSDDPSVLFESDNVVVCQYDKLRIRFWHSSWILTLNGFSIYRSREFVTFGSSISIHLVFQKANGDAEW